MLGMSIGIPMFFRLCEWSQKEICQIFVFTGINHFPYLLTFWHISSSPTKKTRVGFHQSVQMASQKLRKTSTVSWKNMNQYILTRIKCASDEPFCPPKAVFLLLSNLFIFVCLHIMIWSPMTLDFSDYFYQHNETKCNSLDNHLRSKVDI